MVQLAGAGQNLAQRAVQQPPEPAACRALLHHLQPVQHQQQRHRPQQRQHRRRRPPVAGHRDAEIVPRPLQQCLGPVLGGGVGVEAPPEHPPDPRPPRCSARLLDPVGDQRGLSRPAPRGHPDQGDLRVGGPPVQPGQFLGPPGEMRHRLRAPAPTSLATPGTPVLARLAWRGRATGRAGAGSVADRREPGVGQRRPAAAPAPNDHRRARDTAPPAPRTRSRPAGRGSPGRCPPPRDPRPSARHGAARRPGRSGCRSGRRSPAGSRRPAGRRS